MSMKPSPSQPPGPPRPVPVPTALTAPFWAAARRSRLALQYDPATGRYQFLPHSISIASGRRDLEWRETSGKGFVYAVTLTHVPPRGFEDIAPYAVALIELDEHVRIVSRLVNVVPADVAIGLRVRVRFEPLTGDTSYFVFEPDPEPRADAMNLGVSRT